MQQEIPSTDVVDTMFTHFYDEGLSTQTFIP